MSRNLEGVEIMRTGTFRPGGAAAGRKVKVTRSMLQDMVDNFETLSPVGGFTPVLKLGHADAQRFLGQADGAPNLGIVEKVFKKGEKLLANFSGVPDAVIDLIAKRRFNTVSVEVIPEFEHEGKTFANVLTAVAILGAQLPAVKGLKELSEMLFADEVEAPNFEGDAVEFENTPATRRLKAESNMPDPILTQEQHDSLVEAAVAKAIKATKDEFAQESQRLTAERDEARDALKAEKVSFADFRTKAAQAEAEGVIDAAVKSGKLLPKQKEMAVAFLMAQTGTIKFGDEEKSMAAMFAEFIDASPPKVDTSERANGSVDDGEGTDEFEGDPGAEVDSRALKLQEADPKLAYADARKRVLNADPKLADAYTFSM